MKAPIIVLEGLDASGKSTQTELLLENLKKKNVSVGWRRFPGYATTTAGKRIAAYLRGELGTMEEYSPEMIAALYAADRIAQMEAIEKMRDEYDVVIFDRSVTSNVIYTAARAEKKSDIQRLSNYVQQLEYDFFGFPRESLVIFLDASFDARAKIHEAKNRLPDLHEANDGYLESVRNVAIQFCDQNFKWVKVAVDHFGELRRREEIGDEILNLVLEKLQMTK